MQSYRYRQLMPLIPIVLVLFCCHSVLAAGRATVSRGGGITSISNKYISYGMSDDKTTGKVRPLFFENKITGDRYSLDGCGPRIYFDDGTVLTIDDFYRSFGEVRTDPDDKAGSFAYSLINPASQIEIYLIYELDHEGRFLRQRMEVGASDEQISFATRIDTFAGFMGDNFELGGKGQPLFIDNQIFFGMEHPSAINRIENEDVALSYYPRIKMDRRAESNYKMPSTVMGVSEKGNTLSAFRTYTLSLQGRKGRLLVYNTRDDLRGSDLNEDNIFFHSDTLKALFTEKYGITIDAAIIEDGWQDRNSLYKISASKFPKGFNSLAQRLNTTPLGFGISLEGRDLNPAWIRSQGYELNDDGNTFNLTGPNYNKAVSEYFENLLMDSGLGVFKHRMVFKGGRIDAFGNTVDATSGLDCTLDAFQKTQKFLLDNGVQHHVISSPQWSSPWWPVLAEAVMIEDFTGQSYSKAYPAPEKRDWAMSANDSLLYHSLITNKSLMPLSRRITSGITRGRHNMVGGENESLDRWADHLVMNMGRGQFYKELNITPGSLKPEEWSILANLLTWAERWDSHLASSRFVGGDPAKGEVYGYMSMENERATLVLRNPKLQPDSFHVNIKTDLSFDIGRTWAWKEYPCKTKVGDRLNPRRTPDLNIPLAGMETAIVVVANAVSVQNEVLARNLHKSSPVTPGYFSFKSRGAVAAQPVSSGSAVFTLNTDEGNQAYLGLLFEGSSRPLSEYGVFMRVDGASVPASRTVTGDNWQLLCYNLMPGDHDVRVWVDENPLALDRKTTQWSLLGFVNGVPKKLIEALPKNKSDLTANGIFPVTLRSPYQKRVTPILNPVKLPQSKFKADTLDNLAAIRRARDIKLVVEIFGCDRGKYANKPIHVNGQLVGSLPPSDEPVDSWQTVVISIPEDMHDLIQSRNRVSIANPSGDYFKLRNVAIMIEVQDGMWKRSKRVEKVYSSTENWQQSEGDVFKKKTPDMPVSFIIKKSR
jgi:hypothetical protein